MTTQTPATTTAAQPPAAAAKRPTTFAEYLRAAKFDEILPSFMRDKAKDFVRLAMVDIPRNDNLARIAQQFPQKIVSSLMDCARLGLMPGPLGHVYLVPFGDEVQIITGYKGLVALARRSGEVMRVDVGVIYHDDDFVFVRGDNPRFEHIPNLRSGRRTDNDIVAAYAFAYDRDGRNIGGDVMTRADVDAIRRRSKTGSSGPWKSDYAEMAKKTAVRRASKLWPVSTEFAEAAALGEDGDDEGHALPPSVTAPERIESKPSLTSGSLYGDGPEGAAVGSSDEDPDAGKGVGD